MPGHARRPVTAGAVGPGSRPVELSGSEPRGIHPHDDIVLSRVRVGHVRQGETTDTGGTVINGDGLHGTSLSGWWRPGSRRSSSTSLCIWLNRRWWDHRRMPDGAMTWGEVAGRLAPARTYWLSTTTPSGAPHAAPVWGAVTGGTLYLFSERRTVKARNLAADPRVVVHLESGDDVLIVRGVADDLGPPAANPDVIAALSAKYTRPEDQAFLP